MRTVASYIAMGILGGAMLSLSSQASLFPENNEDTKKLPSFSTRPPSSNVEYEALIAAILYEDTISTLNKIINEHTKKEPPTSLHKLTFPQNHERTIPKEETKKQEDPIPSNVAIEENNINTPIEINIPIIDPIILAAQPPEEALGFGIDMTVPIRQPGEEPEGRLMPNKIIPLSTMQIPPAPEAKESLSPPSEGPSFSEGTTKFVTALTAILAFPEHSAISGGAINNTPPALEFFSAPVSRSQEQKQPLSESFSPANTVPETPPSYSWPILAAPGRDPSLILLESKNETIIPANSSIFFEIVPGNHHPAPPSHSALLMTYVTECCVNLFFLFLIF